MQKGSATAGVPCQSAAHSIGLYCSRLGPYLGRVLAPLPPPVV